MTEWTAISRASHANMHWRPRSGFAFAKSQQLVPILVAELAQLLPHYTLAFVADDDAAFKAVALLGLGGKQNLFVNNEDQWLCTYVPAEFRAHPFALMNDQNGNKIFSIYTEHLCESPEQPRLFSDDGELDKPTAAVFDFLSQRETGKHLTEQACKALASAELIEPWQLTIKREGSNEPLKINGLHRINEEKLNQLDIESMAGLLKDGALPLAYAQLFSTAQVGQLTQRAEFMEKQKKQYIESGLGDLFDDDSGTLSFD